MEAAASALIEDDGTHKAQAAVVLGGDGWGTRILKGAQLVRAGWAPFVIVSGPEVYGGHESDITVAYAERQGFPASMFHVLPNSSDSTRTETALLGPYLRRLGINRILLVTSNYHTRRAAWLMRRQNPGIYVDAVPAPDPFFAKDSWWKTRNGCKIFLLEWTKTFAAWTGH